MEEVGEWGSTRERGLGLEGEGGREGGGREKQELEICIYRILSNIGAPKK